jgi:serine/threonine-protein kinase
VPSVTARTVQEATAALEALGFKVERRDQKNDAVPIGQVISQDPRAGTLQAEGSTITLVVSAEATSLSVPSVVGKSLSEAQRALAAAGFDVAKIVVTTRDDDKAERDVVLEQVPAANSKVPGDQQIQLVVAKGVGDITLPNVAGKTCDEAIVLLKAAGVKENKIVCELVADDTVPDTKAIKTEPAGSVTTAQTVKVLISTGKPLVTVPSVVNLTQGAAESSIVGAGLVPQVVFSTAAGPQVVISQSLPAGAQARKGDVVTITVRQNPSATTSSSTP